MLQEELRILSPANGSVFKWMPGMSGLEQDVPLKAWSSGTNEVYWFINESFYRAASPNTPVFWPLEKGKWRMACATASGSASVELVVE